jgi:hypothetical protein
MTPLTMLNVGLRCFLVSTKKSQACFSLTYAHTRACTSVCSFFFGYITTHPGTKLPTPVQNLFCEHKLCPLPASAMCVRAKPVWAVTSGTGWVTAVSILHSWPMTWQQSVTWCHQARKSFCDWCYKMQCFTFSNSSKTKEMRAIWHPEFSAVVWWALLSSDLWPLYVK